MVDRELESIIQQKPVLWVGAGLSVAAGYPSMDAILSALRAAAPRALSKEEFTEVVDEFITATSRGELARILQRLFETPHDPTPTHAAIARLGATGRFAAIVTTNYDDLLERAFAAAHVPLLVETLEHNAPIREEEGTLRLYKLHGAQTDWLKVILSGSSYASFEERYKFLDSQLKILLRQNPLLFTGFSLQDPRVLQWIESCPPEWLEDLMRWRALIRPAAWTAAQNMNWRGGKAGAVLARVPLKAIHFDAHADLQTMWLELAKKLAPLAVGELVFDLRPAEDEWRSVGPTPESAPHTAPNPLRDVEFLRDLRRLRPLLHRSVQANHPHAAAQIAEARHVARSIGARLTATLLSPAAREAVRRRFAEVDRGTARLTLRVTEGPNSDPALALPWELLMPEDDRFAVEEFKLDLVRDAVKPGAPGLDIPSASLSVAAIIAAPDDQNALHYEDESYRMLKALAPLGQVAHFAELGELEDLVKLVDRTDATAVHFSGHGQPGELVFEDELGLSQKVPVTELTAKLRQCVQASGVAKPFPRLFYLASCHGASATLTPAGGSEPDTRTLRAEISAALGEGPSTAATLHREGFACVLGYFGPIGDAASTSAEVALYTSLSEGRTVLHAVKQARAQLSAPHTLADQTYHYPLGWAQLAVYLRGPDRPLTAKPQSAPSTVTPPPRLARETVEVSGLPVLEHGFIGRRGLQHEVRRRLKAGQRLLVLQGLGGLGKTALASQLLCNVLTRDRADQLILRVGDSADIAVLRRQAEEHGNTHGFEKWPDEVLRLLERHPDPVEGFEQTVLALHAHRPGLVLYADNMESLQVGPGGTSELEPGALGTWRPGIERWWAAMESLSKRIVVLASTRYLWMGLDPDALVALDRMSRADLWRMLDTFRTFAKLPWSAREKVADTADGRPRTLERLDGLLREAHRDPTRTITDAWTEWVAPVLAEHGATLTEDLLLAQLWRCVSQAARDQAIAATVLNQPAPRRVLDAMGPAAGELITAGLLTRHRELALSGTSDSPTVVWKDRWSMHASVRQFASALGAVEALRRARTRAANEYAAAVAEPHAVWSDLLEAIDLHLANGDGLAAWPLAHKYVMWLRHRAQYHTALATLARFPGTGLVGDAQVEHTALLAQIRGLAGLRVETTEDELRRSIDAAVSSATRGWGLHELAALLVRQGKYGEAEELHREAVGVVGAALGKEHRDYGASLQSLAGVLFEQGKYRAAERLLRESISVFEKALGKDHVLYGGSLHDLAVMLSVQRKYGAAEGLLRESLVVKEKTLGKEHPDYGASLRVLGGVLSKQGKHGEAEGLLRESLAVFEKALGKEHLSYGESLYSLAEVLSRQGKYGEAEELHRKSLGMTEKALGKEHPDYGESLYSLAVMLSSQGKYGAAEGLLRESLAVFEKALGKDHPSYGTSLYELAGVLSAQGKYRAVEGLLRESLALVSLHDWARVLSEQGRYGEAEGLLRESLTLGEEAQGQEPPEYGASLHQLAVMLSKQGQYGLAEGLLRESLVVKEKTLGKEHLSYGASLHELGGVLSKQGKYGEAEGLLRESLAVHERAQGQEYLSYGVSLHELGRVLSKQGKHGEAEELLRKSLGVVETALGKEHPEYGVSLHEMAAVLSAQGKYGEAEGLLRESLGVVAKAQGQEHRSYGALLLELAAVLFVQGKYGEAEGLLRESLAIDEKALGREHPSLCPTLANLAIVAAYQGRVREGVPLVERALAIGRAKLGDDHPDVHAMQHLLAQLRGDA